MDLKTSKKSSIQKETHVNFWYRRPESNRHELGSSVFETDASTNSATSATGYNISQQKNPDKKIQLLLIFFDHKCE